MIDQTPLTLRGRASSYLDFGGDGTPLIALHGVFGRAASFATLAQHLSPAYRLIALDLRGHGLSEHGGDFDRDAFIEDAAAFVRHLGLGPAFVIGHSMGGVTAYQLAARYPELVRALVIEDIGAVTDASELEHPVLDITGWPRTFPSRDAIAEFFTAQGMPALGYFMDSAQRAPDGTWRMCFDYDDMMAVQHANAGDFRADWKDSHQPALLIRGALSPLLSADQAATMVEARPGTRLRTLPGCGHWIHRDDPTGHANAVRDFLDAHDSADRRERSTESATG